MCPEARARDRGCRLIMPLMKRTTFWLTRASLALHGLAWVASYGITNFRHPARRAALRAVREARTLSDTATSPLECAELYQAVRAVDRIPGDMVEVGVYRGGTAALMLLASPDKHLHLFDTFAGLPHAETFFDVGDYAGSIEDVRHTLRDNLHRVSFHPGLFPVSAGGAEDLRFSMVHLDVDLYDSTLACLQWFWPRMSPGAVLISHDYPLLDGVVRAFAEFFAHRTEPVIQLAGNNCLVVRDHLPA